MGQNSIRYLPALFQTKDTKCRGHNNSLFLVIRRRYTLETFQVTESLLPPVKFMREHSSDSAPKYLRRSTKMVRSARRIRVHAFAKKLMVLHLKYYL